VTLIPVSRVWLPEPTGRPQSSRTALLHCNMTLLMRKSSTGQKCGNGSPSVEEVGAGLKRAGGHPQKKEAPHWRGFWIASGIGI
jgi:hypothetical protein